MTDTHTEAVCGGFDQDFCRRHNHHILAEDTVPSAPIGDAGRSS